MIQGDLQWTATEASERKQAWWRRLRGKILSLLPNCNAEENRPAISG